MNKKLKRAIVIFVSIAAALLLCYWCYRALFIDADTLEPVKRYEVIVNGENYVVNEGDAHIEKDGLLYVTDGKHKEKLEGQGREFTEFWVLDDTKATTLTAYFTDEERYVQLGDVSIPSGFKSMKDVEDRDGNALTTQFDLTLSSNRRSAPEEMTLHIYAYLANADQLKEQGFRETVFTYPQDGTNKAASKAKKSYPGWFKQSEGQTLCLFASPYEKAYICAEFDYSGTCDEEQLAIRIFETAAKIMPGKHLHTLVAQFKLNFLDDSRWQYLLKGLGITLLITLVSGLMGVILGAIVAVIRSTWELNNENIRPGIWKTCLKALDKVCGAYLTIIRGTPVMVQLLIMYLIIFASTSDGTVSAILAFGINSGAYVAEIVRGGIMSIDKGQFEAGSSLGFNYIQTMLYVIMPQVFKSILPALANEFIALLKETSVSGYVAVKDLNKGGDIIRSVTYSSFMPLIAVALIYLGVVMFFTKLVAILERRLRSSEHKS